jgi:predicted RNA-binding protein YlxR (DUF448 family)
VRIVAVPRDDGSGEGGAARAIADPSATLPGRGAYLCRAGEGAHVAGECLAKATRRDAFKRALRARVTLDPKIVESVGP